ncbi:alpha/beta hydrolase [Phyllobacterium myrsinacearum]|jgi:pimeloyl-ACP methyl ester carboxylesterase|uniref:Palmitoyl-protein thioesterase ABHD10, mitochondrial n=1 Tax=Phyllobacterium myrsinacearum TaxID=28101 RepID=A0A2S9JJ20_9HYPH|nr:alpha/beta hydrolase [Phyllobacterium myrsinacearum]PRD53090.1 alpha/beta hydrolase [Phyllobacterium myrsinacearum]PWV94065.1 pimeloyl-ACP methyl ester carboxylesterase [Phyllobacterium myrsinacearum]RZV07496.1 pimeloyl-ACP methyl ester carboxylesterase [Phyllobacterium myrsinacearum]
MTAHPPVFLTHNDIAIALRRRAGAEPGIVWLGGYRSDMLGSKAEWLDQWAEANGHAFLRHDYSGHGESGGAFRDGTISLWLEQSLAVFKKFSAGPQILIGSSMGGWIALRMIEELQKAGEHGRIAGLVLIAPAPDFTCELVEPQLTLDQRRQLAERGYMEEPSEYAPEPYIYTKALLDDGRANQVLKGVIRTGCPVHILQGMEDKDVPYTHALRLVDHLPVDDVTITLVRDGDHRLSRPQDLELLTRTVASMVDRSKSRTPIL